MKSIARGDEACEVELKNVWPASRERPEEERTSRVPHMDIDIDMLDYRITVAYEDRHFG